MSDQSLRRHDLDAVRSLAMLLGIALHAALAYIGIGWVVSDERASAGLGVFVSAVHGFRMPLFFLLSGFFSAMLWRRRGLAQLMSHRARRILLPLAIGCVTIVPAMWGVTKWAVGQQSEQIRESASDSTAGVRAPSPDIWTVAAYGDMEGLRAYTSESEELNTPDPTYGVTPLGWTAIRDTPEATAYLLEIGADPSARYRDLNTPMHTACFFGRADVAQHLIRAGADLTLESGTGEMPSQAMRHDQQTTEFIANLVSIPIDFDEVEAGRARIGAMLEDLERDSSGATVHQQAEAPDGAGSIESRMHGVFFHHLWFLWFLCWLNVGLAVVVLLVGLVPSVKLPSMLVSAPWSVIWLVPLTMLTQSQMHAGGTIAGFGPDTSAGLVPMPHVLLYYATFFGFGALLFGARGSDARLGRWWGIMLPVAIAILPLGLQFGFNPDRAAELVSDETARRWVSVFLQASYAWLMTLGVLGLCEAVLTKDRPWVRYVSDSSYWLYLVHLPLIIWGQALLLRTDLPALAEFAILAVTASAVLLVSYQIGVRYTPIGRLLNGRRTRRGASRPAAEVV